jgi:hypothetical protein
MRLVILIWSLLGLLGQACTRAARAYRRQSLVAVALLPLSLALTGCGEQLPAINQIAMVTPSDGWAVSSARILHYSNGQWQTPADMPPDAFELTGIVMLSADEGWAVGPVTSSEGEIVEAIFHYQANKWTKAQLPSLGIQYILTAVAAASPHDIWAVGNNGAMAHYDGATWTVQEPVGGHTFGDVTMLPDGETWVVSGGNIWRHAAADSTGWIQERQSQPSSTDTDQGGITMVSSSEGWAVGAGGTILHYIGGSWSQVPSNAGSNDLAAVAMVSSSEGWAVGSGGTILHYTGGTWSAVSSPTTLDLHTVAMVSASEGWAGGGTVTGTLQTVTHGVILHFHNGTWSVSQSS